MRAGLVTSIVLHSLVLAWALISIGAPKSFEIADVEALPVDLVPVESITQIQQGDKQAPVKEKAAPTPTKKPAKVENAENAGDNEVDLKTPPTPEKKPVNTEVAAAPPKAEKDLPKADTTNDIKDIQKEETEAAPPTEVAKAEPKQEAKPEVKAEPKQEVKPEPKPEPKAETAEALPEKVPTPSMKPKHEEKKAEEKPAETKVAEAKPVTQPDRKKDEKKKETAKSAASKESDFNAKDIATLLNKADASGGGAKRSTEQAALGGKKTTSGSKLTQSEEDALRGQIGKNWSITPGTTGLDGMMVTVRVRLNPDGTMRGEPEVTASGGSETARYAQIGAAKRALTRSLPLRNLNSEKYDAWGELILNFYPSEMM